MTDAITYTIPVSLTDAYRGQKTVIRTFDPAEVTAKFPDAVPGELCHIRLLSLDGAIEELGTWAPGIPLDLVIRDPHQDLPLLYRYAPLLSTHPLRVSVPLLPGFSAVAKLASSLNFAVKVEGGQPDQALIGELMQLARYYLHRTTVTEPIEFFHSLFLAFYHRDPVTLWVIQEEDPSLVCYVTDSGEEILPGRLAGVETRQGFSSFMLELQDDIRARRGECAGCEFLMNCFGYFKLPRRDYCCDGIKTLMRALLDAVEELRRDLASFNSRSEGKPS